MATCFILYNRVEVQNTLIFLFEFCADKFLIVSDDKVDKLAAAIICSC